MTLDTDVKILLQLIRRHANAQGGALKDLIEEQMGPSFIGAWNKAFDRGLLARGGERHLLKLSRLGQVALA